MRTNKLYSHYCRHISLLRMCFLRLKSGFLGRLIFLQDPLFFSHVGISKWVCMKIRPSFSMWMLLESHIWIFGFPDSQGIRLIVIYRYSRHLDTWLLQLFCEFLKKMGFSLNFVNSLFCLISFKETFKWWITWIELDPIHQWDIGN